MAHPSDPPSPDSADRTALSAAPPSWAVPRSWKIAVGLLLLLSLLALGLAWSTWQRVKAAEAELVKRQQDAGGQAQEARALARQAEAATREAAAKLALLEARVAETTLQRSQIEELIQSLARSRDENLLADLDAALRVAMQQASITGSVEPLAAALRQAQERLARYPQPRLDRVRRAVMQDLDRLKASAGADLPTLAQRLDETMRLIDELPLHSAVDRKVKRAEVMPAAAAASQPSRSQGSSPAAWGQWLQDKTQALVGEVWREARDLIRVTRVDDPQAALLAPEQAFFLRENVKLRLLNARLALMSRHFDVAQADLKEAQIMLERYFDASSRRVSLAAEQLQQVAIQGRRVSVPRPEATLAALAAVAAGR